MTATTPLRELLPGPWYAVLGARALVLLPPEEKRRVPAVWDRVDEGAGFDEVLDALISRRAARPVGLRPRQRPWRGTPGSSSAVR